MGGSTSILAAVEEPGIKAVAADSPYAAASELIAQETARRTIFPGWATPAFLPTAKFMAKAIYGIDIGALTPVKGSDPIWTTRSWLFTAYMTTG